MLRNRPWLIAILQALLTCFSLFAAWLLRFDFTVPYRSTLLLAMPVLLSIRLAAMAYFGLLRGWWKYVGIRDAIDVLKAVGTGSSVFWIAMHFGLTSTVFPRSIYILEALLTSGLLVGVRLLSRAFAESVRENTASCKRVLLIGAGAGAQSILREIRDSRSGYVAVGCLDDDRSKRRVRINNVPVLGTVDQLSQVLACQRVEEVLIAVPSASVRQMRRFVEICDKSKIAFRTLPTLKEIIAGEVTVSQLREVSLDDLLGREPVDLDLDSVRREISGRTVMVTGAAGSIGSELCRQILDCAPAQLVCFDQSENGLFFLRHDLQGHPNSSRLVFCVADICDRSRVSKLLTQYKPLIIFHAAAYKHVPMMEWNVQEAVKNNVLGLVTLLSLAESAGCKNFVLISSDKAVNPTNIMGATKRLGELIVSWRPANGMRCVSVRFGNVLGSSGSVIPVLKQQLRNNQPLTVTHSEVKRFFMITREAVALVLQAFTLGTNGDILVLDMGEPMRIIDLARTLIRLSGKSEDDVVINFTGLRPGEKLEEELFYRSEQVIATACEKVKRVSGSSRNWVELQSQLEELRLSMTVDGAAPVRTKMKEILPEYSFRDQDIPPNDIPFLRERHLDHAVGKD